MRSFVKHLLGKSKSTSEVEGTEVPSVHQDHPFKPYQLRILVFEEKPNCGSNQLIFDSHSATNEPYFFPALPRKATARSTGHCSHSQARRGRLPPQHSPHSSPPDQQPAHRSRTPSPLDRDVDRDRSHERLLSNSLLSELMFGSIPIADLPSTTKIHTIRDSNHILITRLISRYLSPLPRDKVPMQSLPPGNACTRLLPQFQFSTHPQPGAPSTRVRLAIGVVLAISPATTTLPHFVMTHFPLLEARILSLETTLLHVCVCMYTHRMLLSKHTPPSAWRGSCKRARGRAGCERTTSQEGKADGTCKENGTGRDARDRRRERDCVEAGKEAKGKHRSRDCSEAPREEREGEGVRERGKTTRDLDKEKDAKESGRDDERKIVRTSRFEGLDNDPTFQEEARHFHCVITALIQTPPEQPVWACLAGDLSAKKAACERFLSSCQALVDVFPQKEAGIGFLSSIVTATVSHHFEWLQTALSSSEVSMLRKNRKLRSSIEDTIISHLKSVYGDTSHDGHNCRVVVAGKLKSHAWVVASYFLRFRFFGAEKPLSTSEGILETKSRLPNELSQSIIPRRRSHVTVATRSSSTVRALDSTTHRKATLGSESRYTVNLASVLQVGLLSTHLPSTITDEQGDLCPSISITPCQASTSPPAKLSKSNSHDSPPPKLTYNVSAPSFYGSAFQHVTLDGEHCRAVLSSDGCTVAPSNGRCVSFPAGGTVKSASLSESLPLITHTSLAPQSYAVAAALPPPPPLSPCPSVPLFCPEFVLSCLPEIDKGALSSIAYGLMFTSKHSFVGNAASAIVVDTTNLVCLQLECFEPMPTPENPFHLWRNPALWNIRQGEAAASHFFVETFSTVLGMKSLGLPDLYCMEYLENRLRELLSLAFQLSVLPSATFSADALSQLLRTHHSNLPMLLSILECLKPSRPET